MSFQHTIKRAISCSGIGLHSGRKVHMTLRAAPTETGIVFKRTDLPGKPTVKANLFNVVSVDYATSIKKAEVVIKTIEHLMAALAGLGVDNVIVELDAAEVPIMDGSATPFVYLIHEAGLKVQDNRKKLIKLKKTIKVSDGDKYLAISPANNLKVEYFLDFDHPILRNLKETFTFSEVNFVDKIARARTFGFIRDIEKLKRNGLIQGGSLENAIVLDDYRIINGNLRFEDEFTSHKILDLIGDMFLIGHQVLGHITASKAGHSMHIELIKKIVADPSCYTYIEGKEYLPLKRFHFGQLVKKFSFSL